ncbi:MAG: hypothetical protein ACREUJ_02235, partial [Burkholderiales bacterium]
MISPIVWCDNESLRLLALSLWQEQRKHAEHEGVLSMTFNCDATENNYPFLSFPRNCFLSLTTLGATTNIQ